ncbi:hypothetical protein PQE72_gp181 [Bacillus phage vB_BanS_Skywalker]|uniref:Uncharacterized protein n=2 Tax=Caudoviricetes TaxID=2731619 RepID=A0AAE8YVE4_9CAUD|nr:hypothetical protein PQE72_gp181 [Bacillus phage vB_BanS_Skywalker]UGO51262.1 hypothetical protein SKYWALKER_105 [Bacillus phage vB_BanS_Skywalker]
MRWKSNKPQHHGQHRHKTKFLLFPKKIGDEWRWLERATYLQKVERIYLGYYDSKLTWEDVKWIDKEKKKKI